MSFVGDFAELEGNDLVILPCFLFQILGLHDLFLEPYILLVKRLLFSGQVEVFLLQLFVLPVEGADLFLQLSFLLRQTF